MIIWEPDTDESGWIQRALDPNPQLELPEEDDLDLEITADLSLVAGATQFADESCGCTDSETTEGTLANEDDDPGTSGSDGSLTPQDGVVTLADKWAGILGVEGSATGDGRLLEAGSITWENLPIPLRYVSEDSGAHDGAKVVGRILTIERDGQLLRATGDFDLGSEAGREASRQVGEGLTTGVSMDLDDVSFEVRVASERIVEQIEKGDQPLEVDLTQEHTTVAEVSKNDELRVTTEGRIRAATIVAIPAFADANINADLSSLVAYAPGQARDGAGRWAPGGGGGSSDGGGSGGGGLGGDRAKGTPDDPIHVYGDVHEAARLLSEGKSIRLGSVMEASTLIDELRVIVDDALANDEKPKTYDLCKVSVAGSNLFCAENKGIPRMKMPQLAGQDKDGNPLDVEDEWRTMLKGRGIKVNNHSVPSANLRATQTQLDGAKVAGISRAYMQGVMPNTPIFVTRDGYILDGHHRWAGKTAVDMRDGALGDTMMPVSEIDMEIGEAIDLANAYTAEQGIMPQDIGKSAPKPKKKLGAEMDTLVASAPVAPPVAWFADPKFQEAEALRVDEDGRVYGHLAVWDSCHLSHAHNGCIKPPHSKANYAYFKTGSILTAEGDEISVGPITLDTRHAGPKLSAADTNAHYDHTGTVAADVVAGEDNFGIWVAGAMRPGVSPTKTRALRAAPLSGDWRTIAGALELVAALAVNVPGFHVPRPAGAVKNGKVKSLIASGMLAPRKVIPPGTPGALSNEDLKYLKRLASRERTATRDTVNAMARKRKAQTLSTRVHAGPSKAPQLFKGDSAERKAAMLERMTGTKDHFRIEPVDA